MKIIRAVTCISRYHDGDGDIEPTSVSDEDNEDESAIPLLHGFYDEVIRKQTKLSIVIFKSHFGYIFMATQVRLVRQKREGPSA